ncbi:MAG: CmcJ/NvfI family oxidoreductase [Acidimicrobiales bacterium]
MTQSKATLCRATMNYFGGGSVDVDVRDGRAADLPGWEECGFELMSFPSVVEDWHSEAEIQSAHYPEAAALAKRLTGCDRAVVAGHIVRSAEEARRHPDYAPITLVHSDFADSYGDKIRAFHREGADGDEFIAQASRVMILQFWRNLGPAKMDMPLAFCDARTVPRDQIRPFPVTNYAGGGFDFDALGFDAPADWSAHAWYSFPEMEPEEAVALRTYDSDRVADGRPYWTPHSAFRDPEVDLGRPGRTSIEVRVTCAFA